MHFYKLKRNIVIKSKYRTWPAMIVKSMNFGTIFKESKICVKICLNEVEDGEGRLKEGVIF